MGAPSKVDTSPVVHIQSEELFDTYGPRVQTDSIYAGSVATLIERSLRQESMRVPGDGTQLKSLCFVSDIVEGLLQFLALDDGAGTVLNLGGDEGIRMAEVASMVKRLTSSSSMIREEPEAEAPLDGFVPEITRAKEMLGWTPKQTFRKGLIENLSF
jgi:dTDP-glucose 4,6-dehydratase